MNIEEFQAQVTAAIDLLAKVDEIKEELASKISEANDVVERYFEATQQRKQITDEQIAALEVIVANIDDVTDNIDNARNSEPEIDISEVQDQLNNIESYLYEAQQSLGNLSADVSGSDELSDASSGLDDLSRDMKHLIEELKNAPDFSVTENTSASAAGPQQHVHPGRRQ